MNGKSLPSVGQIPNAHGGPTSRGTMQQQHGNSAAAVRQQPRSDTPKPNASGGSPPVNVGPAGTSTRSSSPETSIPAKSSRSWRQPTPQPAAQENTAPVRAALGPPSAQAPGQEASAPPASAPPKPGAIRDVLAANDIVLPMYTSGQHRSLCPHCTGGSTREKSLSIDISSSSRQAKWLCHRAKCGWKGQLDLDASETRGTGMSSPVQSGACLISSLLVESRLALVVAFLAFSGLPRHIGICMAECLDIFGKILEAQCLHRPAA